jgi:hypothetical protein
MIRTNENTAMSTSETPVPPFIWKPEYPSEGAASNMSSIT